MQNAPVPGIQVSCPNCGQRFSARVESIIDAGRDPQAKARFLSGRTNVVQCPNCGVVMQLALPIAYHDHTKEILMVFFPQGVNIPQQERERMVGDITREIMNSLPQDQRKGYLFNPITPLTLEGMIEAILEKDGITREVLQQQREKSQLVEQFLRARPEEIANMVAMHDPRMDAEFFQIMTIMAEAELAAGRQQNGEAILDRRDALIGQTSFGQEAMQNAAQQEQVVMEVANWLQQHGGRVGIEDFMDYLEQVGDSDDHLQALVGLAYNAMDGNFFQALEDRAKNADEERATRIRDIQTRLMSLASVIQQQQQVMIQQAQVILRDILNAPDQDQAIQERLGMFDDMFMQVLAATVQAAEQRGDLLMAARVRSIYEKIVEKMRESAPPEVQFINELLNKDQLEARLMLTEHAAQFGQPLLDYMDALIQNLQGRDADELIEHLLSLREAAEKIING